MISVVKNLLRVVEELAEELASISFNDYFGMGIVMINVPAQSEVSTLGEAVFVRQGDSTVEVSGGPAPLDVAKRFA